MGKDPVETRERAKSRGLRRSRTGVADWASVDADSIRRAICAAARDGGAIRFGYSSDGGAYAVGIYGDGSPYTEWIRPDENVEEVLASIEELFDDIRDAKASAPEPKKQGKTAK